MEFFLFLFVILFCVALIEDEPKPFKPFDFRTASDTMIRLIETEPSDEMIYIKVLKNRVGGSFAVPPMYLNYDFDFEKYQDMATGICPICAGFDMTEEDFKCK